MENRKWFERGNIFCGAGTHTFLLPCSCCLWSNRCCKILNYAQPASDTPSTTLAHHPGHFLAQQFAQSYFLEVCILWKQLVSQACSFEPACSFQGSCQILFSLSQFRRETVAFMKNHFIGICLKGKGKMFHIMDFSCKNMPSAKQNEA